MWVEPDTASQCTHKAQIVRMTPCVPQGGFLEEGPLYGFWAINRRMSGAFLTARDEE